jgi:NOL1/NOP2/fmu family ribosome biogenesis protein
MFRKDPGALADWSLERVERCAGKQEKILDSAHRLLKPGGVLVYATCTFSPEENEEIIAAFIKKYDYQVEVIKLPGLTDHGRVDWTSNQEPEIAKTLRIMPMNVKGEGHFIARLLKLGTAAEAEPTRGYPKSRLKKGTKAELQDFKAFAESYLAPAFYKPLEQRLYLLGEHLYALPEGVALEAIANLKLLRAGLHLGTFKKNRFEPGYALALALKLEEFNNCVDLEDEEPAYQYLKGEALHRSAPKGWVLLGYRGYPLGFGKASEGQIKNHYPKGLRIRKK